MTGFAGRVDFAAGTLELLSPTESPSQPWSPNDGARSSVAGTAREILTVADGEVLRAGQVLGSLSLADADRPPTAAEVVLEAYRRWGGQAVEKLTGAFCVAIWDNAKGTLLLATDRMGLRPLYYGRDGSDGLFATDARSLLAMREDPPRIDLRGLMQFVALGFPLDGRTLFEDVEKIAPGSVVEMGPDVMRTSRYWEFRYRTADRSCRRSSWASQLKEAFLTSMDDLASEDVTYSLPLSGGLDSRCILAGLCHRGRRVRTYTLGSEGSDDLTLAREIARAAGVEHEAYTVDVPDLLGWIEDGVYLTDGMFNAFDTHILFLARHLPPDVRIAFDGTSSCDGIYSYFDVLRSRLSSRRYSPIKQVVWVFTKPQLDERGALSDGGVFSAEYGALAAECIQFTVEDLVNRVSGDNMDPFSHTDWLDQTQRVPRYNMMGTVLLRATCEVRHPYYHPAVIDVVRSMPPAMRSKEKPSCRAMLASLAPQLAAVPWERTGLPVTAGELRIFAAYGRRLAGRWLKRGMPALPGGRFRGTAIDYRGWMRESRQLQGFLRDILLSPTSRQRGYFDSRVVSRWLDEQFSGAADRLALIGRLVTIELCHRIFVDCWRQTAVSPSSHS